MSFLGISLGALAFDSCEMSSKATQQLLNFINCELAFGVTPIHPDHVTSFIGPSTTSEATDIGELLSVVKRTLISPEASAAMLTESGDAPYMLRTVPSDRVQVRTRRFMWCDVESVVSLCGMLVHNRLHIICLLVISMQIRLCVWTAVW